AAALRHVVGRGVVMALYWGLIIAAIVAVIPGVYLPLMTTSPELIAEARRYWPWQGVLPVAGVRAFLWAGVYFGSTSSRALRNSLLAAARLVLPCASVFGARFGSHGRWPALAVRLCVRAGTLTLRRPALVRSDEARPAPRRPFGRTSSCGQGGPSYATLTT